MELRRFFRAPLLLIAVAVLLLLFVLNYANSGSSYQQVDTSKIVQLIDQDQVKSALITDKSQLPQGYNVTIPKSNPILDLLPTAFLYLVIFLLFFFFISQMQGGGSRVMNFGKSRAKLITKDTP